MVIKIGNKKIQAEVADNILKQIKGLMFSEKKNMLFKFSKEEMRSFWMFGVRFPIRMVFIDSDFKVVDIQHAEPLTSNTKSWKVYRSRCKYMLETPFDYKIENGDRLERVL